LNVKSATDDKVICSADLSSGTLSWKKNEELIIERNMPMTMKGKPLFLSLIMCNIENEVDIFV
jgi:hypothetical protein